MRRAAKCGCYDGVVCGLCLKGRSRRSLPCVHEGGVIEPCQGCNGEGRHVRECDMHKRCTRAEAGKGVAVCATCPDFTPDESLLPAGNRLLIPAPPFLHLAPTGRMAVVTVAVGAVGRELLAVSGDPMRRFAERVGADHVVLDWPGHPAWPMSAKFAVARVLDHYDRILYADADVLFRAGCVNPFDLCDEDEFGACDELPWHLQPQQQRFGVLKGYERLRRESRLASGVMPPWYFNLGVYVAGHHHRHLLEAPSEPFRPYHCGEQDLINARILAGEVKVRLLDRRANWQNWTDLGFRHAPADAILHWSGAGHARAKRVAEMRAAVT